MPIVIFFLVMRILRSTLSSVGKESACNAGGLGSISGLGRFPREENSCPLQYSGLENSMDSVVHGVYSAWGNKESDMAETLFSNFQIYKQYCCPTFPHSPPPPPPPSATGNHPSPKLSCLYEFWFFIFLT